MISMIYLFFCFFIFSIQAENKYTSVYSQWKNGYFKYEDFFQRDTYIASKFGLDPCMPLTKTEYIQLLKKNGIYCSGKWCIDGEWKCQYGDSQECYNLEHIIDQKNSDPEFGSKYNKNILGNYIMAYGRWNQQIGRVQDWELIKKEKEEVYKDIFRSASNSVKRCSHSFFDDEMIEDEINDIENFVNFITLVFIFTVIFFGAYSLYSTFDSQKENIINGGDDERDQRDNEENEENDGEDNREDNRENNREDDEMPVIPTIHIDGPDIIYR